MIEKAGFTSVERQVIVTPDKGTTPLDARLTPLASQEGTARVETPRALDLAVTPGAGARLTALSAQGLPSPLPLGWTIAVAFDVRDVSTPLSLSVAGLPDGAYALADYRAGGHAWHLTASNVASAGGALSAELPGPGAYALIVADGEAPAGSSALLHRE